MLLHRVLSLALVLVLVSEWGQWSEWALGQELEWVWGGLLELASGLVFQYV
jgi:hypothetical protein